MSIGGVVTARARIRPLKGRIILYVDGTKESRQAKQLLDSAGITTFVVDGPVEPLDRKPLLIYHGGFYRGLNEIQDLLGLLEFWSNHSTFVDRAVFRDPDEI